MNALRAFEAVSRHGNVSKAADELCVSQGAVSQQLRNLEDHLGRELFDRTPNSITLSEEGESFAAVVQESLRNIAEAASEFACVDKHGSLMISVPQPFAIKWLMPNLGSFYRLAPNVDVVIDESTRLATFNNDGIDGAIRFSDGQFEDLDAAFLFHPELYAVASPDYLQANGALESLARPGEHALLDHQYGSREVRSQHIHWADVVEGNQLDPGISYATYPDGYQAFNAALQGRGIALISSFLIEEELAAGTICYANPEPVKARFSYYFVYPSDARHNAARYLFRDWLVDSFSDYRRATEARSP
jgi:LysR family glycine cleavage system transcriptional activator